MAKPEPLFHLAELILRPPLRLWFDWQFDGMDRIPRRGPLLVACNHISYFDPLAHGLMMVEAGRRPRFLAKKELYDVPILGPALRAAKQIEVQRGTGSLAPVEAAARALADGECVVVYPEGTLSRNPDFTPMQGRLGIARLTLLTGVPVLPVAVWGSQYVWPREPKERLRFRRPIWLKAGPPLDFSRFRQGRDNLAVLRSVADDVMGEIASLVDDLRLRYPRSWQPAGAPIGDGLTGEAALA